jgi:hypothetical protein
MKTRKPLGRELAAVVGLSLVALVTWESFLNPMRGDPDDLAAIKAVIEASYSILTQACLEGSHGQEQLFKKQLVDLWSEATPGAERFAARETQYAFDVATPDPTVWAEMRADRIAWAGEGEAGYFDNYVVPTPDWYPGFSPLEYRWSDIDSCQLRVERKNEVQSVGVDLSKFMYDRIEVTGTEASARVCVAFRNHLRLQDGTTKQHDVRSPWTFYLVKTGGRWTLTSQHFRGSYGLNVGDSC